MTREKWPFSLVFEHGQTWIVLPNGVQLKYLDQTNSVTGILIAQSHYEEDDLAIVCNNLSRDSVFFDVGANVGIYTVTVAQAFDTVEIHAFEPVPETICELKDNLSRNGIDSSRIIVNQSAVGEVDEEVSITTDYHSSNYCPPPDSKQNVIRVPCTTLDTYVRLKSVKRVDLIKVDVEGKELGVLRGAEETLRRFGPIVLAEMIERPDGFFDRTPDDFQETVDFMLALGYKYYIMDDNQDLVHMNSLASAHLERSYHNFLFYVNDVKISGAERQRARAIIE